MPYYLYPTACLLLENVFEKLYEGLGFGETLTAKFAPMNLAIFSRYFERPDSWLAFRVSQDFGVWEAFLNFRRATTELRRITSGSTVFDIDFAHVG